MDVIEFYLRALLSIPVICGDFVKYVDFIVVAERKVPLEAFGSIPEHGWPLVGPKIEGELEVALSVFADDLRVDHRDSL